MCARECLEKKLNLFQQVCLKTQFFNHCKSNLPCHGEERSSQKYMMNEFIKRRYNSSNTCMTKLLIKKIKLYQIKNTCSFIKKQML